MITDQLAKKGFRDEVICEKGGEFWLPSLGTTMGNSDVEEPLLVDEQDIESQVDARISRVNEDYVAVPGSAAEAGEGSVVRRKSSGATTVATLAICCIAAILFVSGAVVSFNSSMRETSTGGDRLGVDSGDWNGDYDFISASKTSFHFQPEKNWMNGKGAAFLTACCNSVRNSL